MPAVRQPTKSRKPKSSEPIHNGAPTWAVARLFPEQGRWTESDYFHLQSSYEGFPRIELSDGRLEVLPMPTELHQLILSFLNDVLKAFVSAHAPGMVLFSGVHVRVRKGAYLMPDLVYMKAEHKDRRHPTFWDGADLVMEVVSPDPKDEERDWETKPKEYARAGIAEYWIVDPQKQLVRVLTLRGKSYKVHGDFGPGQKATSVLLPRFAVAVDEVLSPPGSDPAAS
jgi:Uma2 family endonuclease